MDTRRFLLLWLLFNLPVHLDIAHAALVFQAPEYNSYKVLRAAPGFQTKGNEDRQCVIGSDPPKKGSTVQMYNVVRVSIKLR